MRKVLVAVLAGTVLLSLVGGAMEYGQEEGASPVPDPSLPGNEPATVPVPARGPFVLASRAIDDPQADLFTAHSWYVPPPPRPVVKPKPVAPTAPPMPFAWVGTYAQDDTATTYFLTRGDAIYDVRIGDTLDRTYRLDAEADGQLSLTYLPLQLQQTLSYTGGP